MAKNIVLCADGTGNTGPKNRGTNVFRMFEAIILEHPSMEQVAFYSDGVGTESNRVVSAITGALGIGLAKNIRELYTSLARVYEDGDRIYLFGFSRGAYTARLLADFICREGILNAAQTTEQSTLSENVRDLFARYRMRRAYPGSFAQRRMGRWMGLTGANERLKEIDSKQEKADEMNVTGPVHPGSVEFLGIWDSVDAYAIPFDSLSKVFSWLVFPFKIINYRLHPQVSKGCHALALDDQRWSFHPDVWDESNNASNRIEQVWFAGMHSNVGGGYPKQGMALASLYWMMEKAKGQGLKLNFTDWWFAKQHANHNGKMYNSRAGLALYYRYRPRNLNRWYKDRNPTFVPKIHDSVFRRIRDDASAYAPLNIPENFAVVGGSATANADIEAKLKNKIPAILAKTHAYSVSRMVSQVFAYGLSGVMAWILCRASVAQRANELDIARHHANLGSGSSEASEAAARSLLLEAPLQFIEHVWGLVRLSSPGTLMETFGFLMQDSKLWIPFGVAAIGLLCTVLFGYFAKAETGRIARAEWRKFRKEL